MTEDLQKQLRRKIAISDMLSSRVSYLRESSYFRAAQLLVRTVSRAKLKQ